MGRFLQSQPDLLQTIAIYGLANHKIWSEKIGEKSGILIAIQ